MKRPQSNQQGRPAQRLRRSAVVSGLVGLGEQTAGGGERRGESGRSVDDRGDGDRGPTARCLKGRVAEGAEQSRGVAGRHDRLGLGERGHGAPYVDRLRLRGRTTATLLLLASLWSHVVASVRSASGRMPSATRNWSASRSANELDLGRTSSAMCRLPATTSSTRSSTVPGHTSRWDTTVRVWPIRQARSRAWSSTAGFHQRSYSTTWLAAVRLRPVPPALSDSTSAPGPSPCWKSATRRSRAPRARPPW